MTALRPSNLRALRLDWVVSSLSLRSKADVGRNVCQPGWSSAGVGHNRKLRWVPQGGLSTVLSIRADIRSALRGNEAVRVLEAGHKPRETGRTFASR